MRYIALLRGVNVGGHQVKMERLRAVLGEMGLGNVRTYIQSGNVFFDTDDSADREALTTSIEARLGEEFGFAIPVCLRTVAELEEALALNPFTDRTVTPEMRLCIVFAAQPIPQPAALPIWSPKRDMEVALVTRLDAYVVWYLINGRPPAVSPNFLGKLLGSASTSRFLHTTAKILEAAKAG